MSTIARGASYCCDDLRLAGRPAGDLRSRGGRGQETRAQQPVNRRLSGHQAGSLRSESEWIARPGSVQAGVVGDVLDGDDGLNLAATSFIHRFFPEGIQVAVDVGEDVVGVAREQQPGAFL